eukprot:TRINITY_DN224_c0_g1_i1.p1 TRINITY_DN224_c0_g1~~TRINITY_DN224_c0_g1_i1.p1  ORF type:complete len:253 (+),score=59.50 TRINITY_DN224_c0_g1_i1:160-918(+)
MLKILVILFIIYGLFIGEINSVSIISWDNTELFGWYTPDTFVEDINEGTVDTWENIDGPDFEEAYEDEDEDDGPSFIPEAINYYTTSGYGNNCFGSGRMEGLTLGSEFPFTSEGMSLIVVTQPEAILPKALLSFGSYHVGKGFQIQYDMLSVSLLYNSFSSTLVHLNVDDVVIIVVDIDISSPDPSKRSVTLSFNENSPFLTIQNPLLPQELSLSTIAATDEPDISSGPFAVGRSSFEDNLVVCEAYEGAIS